MYHVQPGEPKVKVCTYCGKEGHTRAACSELNKLERAKHREFVEGILEGNHIKGLPGVEEHKLRGRLNTVPAFGMPVQIDDAVNQVGCFLLVHSPCLLHAYA